MSALDAFGPASRQWFREAFHHPTPVQADGWRHVAQGEHALLLAPTGSGKTLAAFFYAIDRVVRLAPDAPPGVRILYVSPLKALVADIERNLRAPLVGVLRHSQRLGLPTRAVEVGMRTGDTPAKVRAQMRRTPPDILVTTPESLFLLLGSQAAATLTQVHTVIVDEIHALAGSKRGAHLALSLERLEGLCKTPPQRIGLSATVRPHDEAARFLAGARDVAVVDHSQKPALDLAVEVPVVDMTRPPPVATGAQTASEASAAAPGALPANSAGSAVVTADADADADASGSILGQIVRAERASRGGGENREPKGLWAAIYPRILALLQAHRTTLVFVNSRSSCERMARHLNEMAGEPLVRAHHGSVSLKKRSEIEEALKAGSLRGIVATSSLELGIDMGSVDLVVLVESPGAVGRGLQRVGRAGHGVGQVSKGVLFPKHQADLLECAVVAGRMRQGLLEPLTVPQNPLDVLAQQLVAVCAETSHTVDALHALVRRSYPFHQLSREALTATLDMLTGHYPSDEFAELRPLLSWDRAKDEVVGRRGAKVTTLLNAGTIPDRGTYGVFMAGEKGPRVGELDEEMVHESRQGDVFMLGASSWRIAEITRDKVLVTPAPGEPGKLPFWRGEGPGRPIELGRALGEMTRRLEGADAAGFRKIAQGELGLDKLARQNLRRYLDEQREATGSAPSDRHVVIERFRDEVGDWRVCVLTPFGARVHAPWALAIEAALGERLGRTVQTFANDDGIVLRLAPGDALPDLALLLPDPEAVEERIVEELGRSALFAGAFRENAARALLLPRRFGQGRAPLWQQRLRSKTLLAAAQRYPSFPMVLETYRQCLRDIFDVPALVALLQAIGRREIRVSQVETRTASPFARSLAFAYVAAYLYGDDAPLAERRAHALTLDRSMLRGLLGEVALRSLLDQGAIDATVATLQRQVGTRRARDADGVHDLLRTLGDLTVDEVVARCRLPAADANSADGAAPADDPPAPRAVVEGWLGALKTQRRAFVARVGGEPRWLAVDDAARYRDALGVVTPSGLPTPPATGAAAGPPLRQLLARYARTHGPFLAEAPAARYALTVAVVRGQLDALVQDGSLVHGALLPHGEQPEWCDAEVLRRLKRATLAQLRNEVAALPATAYGRFLPAWHGLDAPRRGSEGLYHVLQQLAGLPLSFAAWCTEVLPARVSDFTPDLLDMLCATGAIVWVGAGALGSRDGRVAFYARAQARTLLPPPAPYPDPTPLHAAVLQRLLARGPAFTVELQELACAHGGAAGLHDVLWDLVWAGLLTNDTVQPLRALQGRARGLHAVGGRWSATAQLLPDAPAGVDPTAASHARAVLLLERYGVASRQAAAYEDVPGGFTPVYQVLKAMEEAGKVRRGLFVDGLGGAQFAFAGAIERLRAGWRPEEGRTEAPLVLSAVDPANPYGSLLAWPERYAPQTAGPLRRVPGARVILHGGALLGYLDPSGEALALFAALRTQPDGLAALVAGLGRLGRNAKGRSLRLQRIEGTAALQHPLLAQLLGCGMAATFDGLMLADGA